MPPRPRALPAVALTAALLVAACSPGGGGAPAASPSPRPAVAPRTYLALGDSVAAGVGADDPRTGGYVPLLAGLLRDRLGCRGAQACPLTSRDLAVSGATTAAVLRDQLPALRRLVPEVPPVRLVTVTVGGNDVFLPVLTACALSPASPACTTAATDAVTAAGRGAEAVLAAVDATVPDATVAVMTYYDPLPACRLAALSPLAKEVLEGGSGRDGLNDVLRAAAGRHGAVVVETADVVTDRGDLVGGGDCLHPSGQGHAALARAFDAAVGAQVAAR